MDHYFKSTVYHLYHGHTTPKHDLRFEVFNKFKAFDKKNAQEYVKQKGNDWGIPVKESTIWEYINTTGIEEYYNENTLNDMLKSQTPVITLCIVSYRRFEVLLKVLQQYISFNIPINILLWLNSYEDYTQYQLQQIKNKCKQFYSSKIMYCDTNIGTGHSRNVLLSRAYREYNTPYIMTSDDDIFYNTKEELLIGASVLDQRKYFNYGAIGIWCEPIYNSLYIINKELRNYKTKKGFQTVDALGAATMTIKRDILKYCNVDPNYKIGWVDTDFSFNIRSNNYKLGLICDNRWKPINIAEKTDKIYKEARSNKKTKQKSKDRFVKKWGIKPVWRYQNKIGEYNES